ncbi:MAG: hypothetical protein ABI910_20370 [Gemmatimonadota bacterium]
MLHIHSFLPSRMNRRWLPVLLVLVPGVRIGSHPGPKSDPDRHVTTSASAISPCGSGAAGTADCLGQLPVNWKTQTNEAKLFADILAKIDVSSNERYGVRGGVVKNIQGGAKRWKMVEPLEDANRVDISNLKSPVVIGRLRHLRGADEIRGQHLKKGDNVAFLVAYPDVYGEAPDVNDGVADYHAYYRIVKLRFTLGFPRIDVGPAIHELEVCHVNPNDESSALHPQRPNAQAQFATCASSMMSSEEFADLFTLQIDVARRQALDTSNVIRSIVLREQLRFYDAEKARTAQARGSFGKSNFLEWVGSEGVWFTCGLGCCYTRPVL